MSYLLPTTSDITIGGQHCTGPECMTIRCAIEHLASWLAENGLGDDEHGKNMCEAYLKNIATIREKLRPS